jgi:hypothetical protein
MLFANTACKPVPKGPALLLRRELLGDIVADFRRAFPDLLFEIDEASSTVNAQAIMRAGARIVRLYGGLAYHTAVGADGLVFMLLHEAGHHLAPGGRLALRADLACECAADRWALTRGAAQLRKQTGRIFAIAGAVSSLETLAGPPCGKKDGPKACWSMSWSRRKRILAGSDPVPAVRRCHLSEFFRSEVNYA